MLCLNRKVIYLNNYELNSKILLTNYLHFVSDINEDDAHVDV